MTNKLNFAHYCYSVYTLVVCTITHSDKTVCYSSPVDWIFLSFSCWDQKKNTISCSYYLHLHCHTGLEGWVNDFSSSFFKQVAQHLLLPFSMTLESDLTYKALDVGWIFDLAAVGTIKSELHILQRDGCVTLHYITRPYMTLKHSCFRGKCTFFGSKNLWQNKRKREKGC